MGMQLKGGKAGALTRREFMALTGGAALAAAGAAYAQGDGSAAPVVKTSNGPIRGVTTNGIHTFKGVRYAAPPVGPLRFMPPQKPAPWKDVVETSAYGASAIQMASGPTANPVTELSKQLATVFTTSVEMKTHNED
ncbi:MAG: carboxylesterase family protein, partial [Candidatus Hydrogenedentota bacterium]